MGHKINPVAFRLGIQKDWKSRWFNTKNFKAFLEEDFVIRSWLEKKLAKASLESVEILRSGNSISVIIKSARPGMIIGRGGKGLEELQLGLKKALAKIHVLRNTSPKYTLKLEIEEIKKPELYAKLVGQSAAEQIEKRMPFRRVMKQVLEKVSGETGVKGVKICMSGRLGGAEISRTEHMSKGKIPLQNLRADIDYGHTEAHTTYGIIGIKVWIYRGDLFADAQVKK